MSFPVNDHKHKPMKKLILSLLICASFTTGYAQGLEIFGLKNDMPFNPANPTAQSIQLVKLDPFTGNWNVVTTIPNSNSIAYGSKSYDHGQRRFIYWGTDDTNATKFYTISVDSGTVTHASMQPSPINNSGAPQQLEYDLQADTTYGMMYDLTQNTQYFITVSLQNGTIDTVASLPGIQGSVNLASTFNSNHHRYIFQGYSGTGQNTTLKLFTIDALTGAIVHQPQLNAGAQALIGLEYDLNTDQLYSLHTEIDYSNPAPGNPNTFYQSVYFVEIDTATGAVTKVSNDPILEGFDTAFLVGANDFDQQTSTYIFVGKDENSGGFRIFLIDAATGTVSFDVPYTDQGQFLQCDNQVFAQKTYGGDDTVTTVNSGPQILSGVYTGEITQTTDSTSTNITELSAKEYRIYPNPATTTIHVRTNVGLSHISIFSQKGERVHVQSVNYPFGEIKIDVDHLPAGMYTVVLHTVDGKQGRTKALIR